MLRFDKLKLVMPLDAVTSINEDEWKTTIEGGAVIERTFKQTNPCLIILREKLSSGELVVEFTGKILKDDYSQLINRFTIKKCIEAINALRICELDVDYVIQHAKVTKCDVTIDVLLDNFDSFKTMLETHIKQPMKWNVRHYGKNLVIEKNVKTPKMQRRMAIYDKEQEISTNNDFLHWVSNPNEIRNYFAKKKRFELTLYACQAIKEELHTSTCDLMDVLSADTLPHIAFFEKLLKESTTRLASKSIRIYNMESTLIRHDWQLRPIENLYRELYPKSFRNSMLDDYRALIVEHNQSEALQQFDFQTLFDNDEVLSTSTITNVDINYWTNCTAAPKWDNSWDRIDADNDYSFINDRTCIAPQSVLQ